MKLYEVKATILSPQSDISALERGEMVKWLGMMHATSVVPSSNSMLLKLLLDRVVAQTSKRQSLTEIIILTVTNCEM